MMVKGDGVEMQRETNVMDLLPMSLDRDLKVISVKHLKTGNVNSRLQSLYLSEAEMAVI